MTIPAGAEPTQVRRPWRSTARTVFQALIGLAVLFPVLVQTAGLDPASLPWLAGALAIAGAVARIMALPGVEEFLRRFLPFLAAAPSATSRHRDQAGYADAHYLLVTTAAALAILLAGLAALTVTDLLIGA